MRTYRGGSYKCGVTVIPAPAGGRHEHPESDPDGSFPFRVSSA